MEFLISLILFLLAIFIDYLIATEFADAAADKGYTQRKYFWMCFLLGPVGYLLVVALPDRGKPATAQPPVAASYTQPPAAAPYGQPVVTPPQYSASPVNTFIQQQPQAPAPKGVHQVFSDGSWQCICGRRNMRYVSTCVCGESKHK